MPPTNTDDGLRAALEIRKRWPDISLPVLSQYVEVSYADDLLADGRGGIGYLLKDRVSEVSDFLDGLSRVAAGGTVLEVSEKVLVAITRRDNPQMVVGVFSQKFLPLKDIRAQDGDVWVALDRVRDPGNLGTIIRTVDAVGGRGVILIGETTDPFAVEAVRYMEQGYRGGMRFAGAQMPAF